VIAPNGAFLYADGSKLLSYSIDQGTGALTPTGTFTFPQLGGVSESITIEPSVKYVYATGATNSISTNTIQAFSVNAKTGVLTPIPDATTSSPNLTVITSVETH
jgi:hypothetical protein